MLALKEVGVDQRIQLRVEGWIVQVLCHDEVK